MSEAGAGGGPDHAEETAEAGDPRWAFGTGFADPLSGVDPSPPADVDGGELAAYCLMLGDDALVMSHRLQQWCANLPELEEEIAVANIALDLLGQARLLFAHAGVADGSGAGEDWYAFFRDEREFRNVRLVERPNGDFAELIVALLAFSAWRLALLSRLAASRDPMLSAIAAKGVHEVAYHRDYAAQWAVRLGDGTDFSRQRTVAALAAVWPLIDELFAVHEVESRMAAAGVGVDPSTLREEVDDVLAQVLGAAGLPAPEAPPLPGVSGRAGRHGVHTEAMGPLLAELQSVARAHPGAVW